MSRRSLFLPSSFLAALALVADASAKPAAPTPKKPDPATTTLSAAPAAKRIRFDVAPGAIVVTHDYVFAKSSIQVAAPRGSQADATLYLAFTGQARPLAVEASLYA